MGKNRANSSVVAILVLLLVIAGVLYLFWQNQKIQMDAEPAPLVEEIIDTAEPIVSEEATEATTDSTDVEDDASLEVPALDADSSSDEMVVTEEETVVDTE